MIVKHANMMINLLKLHMRLEDEYLKFYDNLAAKPVHVIKFKDKKTASFAYGRIIHAVLRNWEAVDVTEHIINDLMEKWNSTEELPSIT